MFEARTPGMKDQIVAWPALKQRRRVLSNGESATEAGVDGTAFDCPLDHPMRVFKNHLKRLKSQIIQTLSRL